MKTVRIFELRRQGQPPLRIEAAEPWDLIENLRRAGERTGFAQQAWGGKRVEWPGGSLVEVKGAL